MTLRWKTTFILGASLLGLLTASYLTISSVLLDGFLRHEREDAIQNVERIREVIADSLVNLSVKVWDWANWDDLYRFAADANPDFTEANLRDNTFIELKLHAILVFDSSRRLLVGKAFDLSGNNAVPLPEALTENMLKESSLLQHADPGSSRTGLLGLPDGPMLVAARPILTSGSQGPMRGTLIMGAYLNADKIRYMARETRLDFSVETLPLHDRPDPQDFATALKSLSREQPIHIGPLSEEKVAGYTLLEDIYGQPIAVVRVVLDRGIYRQGRVTLRYLVASLLLIGLVYGGVTLLLLEKGVLARVIRIIREVDDIGLKADAGDRLPVTGTDELSTLAQAINAMLEALETSQDRLRQANEQLEARVLERTLALAGANESLRAEIAERAKAEDSLHRSELEYRNLFMNAPIGIFQTTPDGRFLTANPALARTSGMNPPKSSLPRSTISRPRFTGTPPSVGCCWKMHSNPMACSVSRGGLSAGTALS